LDMPRLTLRLLGPPRIELDGQPVQLGRHKAVALLAYLALTRQPHSRDALATLLWPELDQSHARGQLRRTLSLLNRTLGNEWLDVDRETVAWSGDADVRIDVDALRQCLAACAAHGHPSEQTCAECVPLLEEAVELYRDGFLAGFTLPDAPAFDEWQFFEGEELREQVADALQRLAHWYGDQGEHESAIPYARRWLALDPLHEPAQRELMSLYARSGQRAAALRQYAECERVLEQELGVAPSSETTECYEHIRDGQDLSGSANLTGLSADPRHNLPAQLTAFVGREMELAELSELLAPGAETRLVTVVGPGGMGKTRLALEAASRQLDAYAQGVWSVSLAALQSAEAIVPAVAQALGMPFYRGEPPRQQLLRYLRDRRTMLVLDSFEHLLEGSDLLVELLRTAPGVHLLITSHVRLNVTGEFVFMLAGMDYPEPSSEEVALGELRRYSSVTLFLRSARQIRSAVQLGEKDLPSVARVCQLAEGMPLAILLAAAWVPALTPAEIAAEMERSLDFLAADWQDEPERHHSMRAAFDSTWQRLAEEERQAFAGLSVFRGGFTRQAAEVVVGTDLRTLISLVNKSLLQRDRDGRYEVHELLRQYAAEKLDEDPAGKERVLNLHCAFYAELLDREKAEIDKGHAEKAVLELDNIRAAWQHAVSHRWVAKLAQSLEGLAWLYLNQGLFREADTVLGQAVAALRSGNVGSLPREETILLGNLLARQGYHAFWSGRDEETARLLRESEQILRDVGEKDGLAHVLVRRAVCVAVESGAEAEELLLEALAIWRGAEKWQSIPLALNALGECAVRRGAYREAAQYGEEALEIGKRLDHGKIIVWALSLLGQVAYARCEYDRAKQLYERQLSVASGSGTRETVADSWYHLGEAAFAMGEYEAAAQHYTEALGEFEKLRIPWVSGLSGFCRGIGLALVRLGHVALAVGSTREAERRYAQALQSAASEPYPELSLEAVLGQAKLLAQKRQAASSQEMAAELATLVLCHPDGLPETRDAARRLLEEMQATLSSDALTAAQERSRSRDLGATMQELLAEFEGEGVPHEPQQDE